MDTGEEPQRQRFCCAADCGVVFWICRSCDRRQQYCGDRCRQKARRQARVTDMPSPAPLDSGNITMAPSRPRIESENGAVEPGYADDFGFGPACIVWAGQVAFIRNSASCEGSVLRRKGRTV